MLLKWTHAYTEYHIKTSQAAMLASHQNTYVKSHMTSAAMSVPEIGPLEASQHAVFYRMCQAVFYIFCYRQSSFRDMLEQNTDILHTLRLDALIFSPLNPMRYISQTVIDEFLRVNDQLGHIVHCDELVQRNHRLNQSSRVGTHHASSSSSGVVSSAHRPKSSTPHASNGESSGGGIIGSDGSSSGTTNAARFDPNDIFFPFDPYQLKHSSAYIDNLYIAYRDEDDEDDEEVSSGGDADADGGPASLMEDEEYVDSRDPSSSHLSKPIRIGGVPRANHAISRSPLTSSPELDASVSSMSASFSDQLSVDETRLQHGELGSAAVDMSFEMDHGRHLPQSTVNDNKSDGRTTKTRRMKEEKKSQHTTTTTTPARKGRTINSHMRSSSDEDEENADPRGLVLSEQDLSFSPNSPSFAPLDDSPHIRGKRK
jgi:hypothetical protein